MAGTNTTENERVKRLTSFSSRIEAVENAVDFLIQSLDDEAKELGLDKYVDYYAPVFDTDSPNDIVDVAIDEAKNDDA